MCVGVRGEKIVMLMITQQARQHRQLALSAVNCVSIFFLFTIFWNSSLLEHHFVFITLFFAMPGHPYPWAPWLHELTKGIRIHSSIAQCVVSLIELGKYLKFLSNFRFIASRCSCDSKSARHQICYSLGTSSKSTLWCVKIIIHSWCDIKKICLNGIHSMFTHAKDVDLSPVQPMRLSGAAAGLPRGGFTTELLFQRSSQPQHTHQ